MTLILDPPGEPTVAEQIEHFYEAARYHTRICECGICDGVNGLRRIALALLKENEGFKAFKQSVDEALNSGDGAYRP